MSGAITAGAHFLCTVQSMKQILFLSLGIASFAEPAVSQDSLLLNGMHWRHVGPNRGGRVTTVTGVPSQPNTFYMGAASGGVWKTTDAGATWQPISDDHFQVASIGDIAVSLSDPNTIYVGTGSDGLRSNVSIGRGVYKSTDAGRTWSFVGLREVGQIGAVRIHPTDPNIVYVSAVGNPFRPNPERGIFKTENGGRTWRKVLFVSDSTGAADVELQPGNPSTVFAVMSRAERKPWTIISGANEGGIYKSTDGGDNWTRLRSGLPSGLIGKGNLGVTNANPNRLYLLYEAKPGGGVYRSDDAGATWTQTSSMGALIQRPFYYTTLTADPTNADVVYAGAEGFYRSEDAGKTFRPLSTPHGDNHDIWINPNDGDIMIQSNDGGANVSLDRGRTWSTQYNQPTAEIYQVYLDNQFPYRLYGAQQDNSTLIVPSLPLGTGQDEEWRTGPGCETGPIMPHPTNPDTVYASCKGQYSRMSLRTGQEKQYWIGMQSLYGNPGKDLILRFQRVSPMEISPFNPSVLYYGSQYVHRTRDEGVTWERISPDLTWNPPERQQTGSGEPITRDVTGEENYSTLYAIEESPIEQGVIWTGANDGPYHVTRNNGRTWEDVTPKDLPRGCRVGSIEPSRHRRGTAYYASYCYLLGHFAPYIYRTTDYGKSWTKLTNGSNGIAGDNPTRVVREDSTRQGLLFAGTEFGMYVSLNDGESWQPFMQNMPVVPINDIKVKNQDVIVATQGRGFWIMDNLTPFYLAMRPAGWADQAPANAAWRQQVFLYAPREAYRLRYSAGRRSNPASPEYPQPGVQLDYWIPAGFTGDVTLTIKDAAGSVIRTFTSAETQRAQGGQRGGAAAAADDDDERPSRGGGGATRLTKTAGLNRFTWDMRYPGPWSAQTRANAPGGGPMAVPGTYTAEISSTTGTGGTQQFVLKPDPRVVDDGVTVAVMKEQFDFAMKARDLVSEATQLVAGVRQTKQRLGNATGAAADTLRMVTSIEQRLVTPSIRYSKPELQTHIQYLYSVTNQADQKPGRDWYERYDVLKKELDALKAEAGKIPGVIAN